MSPPTVIYAARRIITMNPSNPTATHVAVRDGRILGAGTLSELQGWGAYTLDRRFADKVLLPGFVEGHCHGHAGGIWTYPYVGFFDCRAPDGKMHRGLTSLGAVVARLREIETKLGAAETPLVVWGFDPIYFDGRRMNLEDLDSVSKTRPVIVMHSNGHVINVNRSVLQRAGVDRSTNVPGVVKDAAGEPTGELAEMTAKFIALRAAGSDVYAAMFSERGLRDFARIACLAGVTTATDLYNELKDATVEIYCRVASDDAFMIRLVPALAGTSIPAKQGVEKLKGLVKLNSERLRFGLVKLMTDGSIQGLSARMNWPGYFNGMPNGVWNTGPDEIDQMLQTYHDAGYQVHAHTNGDQASEMVIDAVERALARNPRADHRHTLQHAQMVNAAMFQRMRALGLCANLFANHIFYWGDIHYAQTLGPERANRMDACATALRCGVPLAIHSDAPVTPIAPLFTAWCAVNRLTASGRVLGAEEKIGVADALRAITLGAAYTLKLDHEIGSIEAGKRADFAVLDDDPLMVSAEALKDVGIWGTVLGGRIFEAARA